MEDKGGAPLEDDTLHLIRAAKGGDREAFTVLVRRYKDAAFRTALAVAGDKAEAEDVVQESFVRAYLSLKTLQDDRAFPAWLATLVTRRALDAVQKRRRELGMSSAPLSASGNDPAPAHDPELHLVILDALNRLSPEHRAVIVLRDVQGFHYQEIAEMLEIPVGTVRSRLHHARMHLRRLLYPDSTGGTS